MLHMGAPREDPYKTPLATGHKRSVGYSVACTANDNTQLRLRRGKAKCHASGYARQRHTLQALT